MKVCSLLHAEPYRTHFLPTNSNWITS